MNHLPLGPSRLPFSAQREARADLRHAYEAHAKAAQDRYETQYGDYASLDQVMAQFPSLLSQTLDETAAAVASDLARSGIYDWDDAAVREALEARLGRLMATFAELESAYQEIGIKAEAREVDRAYQGAGRSYISGGGFGLDGAAKGMAVASAANVALGLVYGAADAAGRALASREDERTKRALFEDPQTRRTLAKAIRDVAFEGQAVLAEVLNRQDENPRVEEITAEAERRAAALANNVASGRVPDDQIQSILTQAIDLNPYAELPWRLWIEKLEDRDGSVLKAAQTIGILGLEAHRDALLAAERNALKWSTPEECLQNSPRLEARAAALGVPFDAERDQIARVAEQLDLARRTYKGSLYPTEAEAKSAQSADEDAHKRTVVGVTYDTHDEADEARAEWLDLQSRTFRNKEYLSARSAKTARVRYHRSSSLVLWFGVLIAPFPTALLTLQPGFARWQRITAFAWLALIATAMFFGGALRSPETAPPLIIAGFVLGTLAWLASLLETFLRTQFMTSYRRRAAEQALGERGADTAVSA